MLSFKKAAWLLRLEMQLAIRSTVQYSGEGIVKLLAAGLGILYLILNGLFAILLPPEALRLAVNPDILVISATLLVVMFAVLSANQMFQLMALRHDALLIFLSPFPASVVLLVRILVAAFKTALLPLFIVTPVLNQFIFRGQIELLGFIPAALAFSILVSCAWTVVFSLGVRKIGTGAMKMIASFSGLFAALALGTATTTYHSLHAWTVASHGSGEYAPGMVWLSSAIVGNVSPLSVLLLAALTALVAVSVTQHGLLSHLVLERTTKSGAAFGDSRFSSSLIWAILKKEWRLVLRDPAFWFHFVRIIFVVFVAAGFLYKTGFGAPVIAVAIVVACCVMANDLSWMMVATEQAPELIAASPLPFSAVLRGKILAAGSLPVATLLIICSVYGFNSIKLSIIPCLIGLPAIAATVALNTVMSFRQQSLRISQGTTQPASIVAAQGSSVLCFALLAWFLSRQI